MQSSRERRVGNAIDAREPMRKREVRNSDCDVPIRSATATNDGHKKAHLSAGFFVFDVAAPEGFEPPNA